MDQKKAFEEYASPGEDSGLSEKELEERANVQGVWFEEDYLRIYPFMSLPVIPSVLLFREKQQMMLG